jgi:transposase InsO family protein
MPKNSVGPTGHPSEEALYRFRVVSDVLARELRGQRRQEAISSVSSEPPLVLSGAAQRSGPRTIYRWLAAFEKDQIAGLERCPRSRTKSSVVLSERLLEYVAAQKQEDVQASLPEIVKRARVAGIVAEQEPVDRTTLYRACLRMGVCVERRRGAKIRDSRRFAYPHRMDMLLSDGKHFRAGALRARRLAMFFLDDASRFGHDVVVGPSESGELFQQGLYQAIQRSGLPGIIYLDRGSGFIANDTVAVVGQLPALLIHGERAYPEGHGKIEKFNQTVGEAVLRHLDGRPDVDPDCGALQLRLRHWLHEVYNHTPHESLHGLTPWQRFSTDERPLRFPESLEALRERFVVHLQRRVSPDHVVTVDDTFYEVPRGLAGSKTTVYRQVLDGTVRILFQGKLVKLLPVDLAANAHARRAGRPDPEDDLAAIPTKSAADLTFDRDFASVVGPDGGFSDPHDEE